MNSPTSSDASLRKHRTVSNAAESTGEMIARKMSTLKQSGGGVGFNHSDTNVGEHELASKSGVMEVLFSQGSFASWNECFLEIDGVSLNIFKNKKNTTSRIASILLGRGVYIETAKYERKYPRRFDVFTVGGALPTIHWSIRGKSRKECISWANDLAHNVTLLSAEEESHENGGCVLYQNICPDIVRLNDIAVKMAKKTPKSDKDVALRGKVKRCFSGNEAVDMMMKLKVVDTEEDAIELGKKMLFYNVIHHVLYTKGFVKGDDVYQYSHLESASKSLSFNKKYLDPKKFWRRIVISERRSNDSVLESTRSLDSSVNTAVSPSTTVTSDTSNATHQTTSSDTRSQHSVAGLIPENVLYKVKLLDENEWQNPKSVATCNTCSRKFSGLRRKHHCRLCGKVVCSNCAKSDPFNCVNVGLVKNIRVCIKCRIDVKEEYIKQHPKGSKKKNRKEKKRTSSFSSRSSSFSSLATTSSVSTIVSKVTDEIMSPPCPDCENNSCAIIADEDFLPFPYCTDVVNKFVASDKHEKERCRVVNQLKADVPVIELLSKYIDMVTISSDCTFALIEVFAGEHCWVMTGKGINVKSFPRETSISSYMNISTESLSCKDLKSDLRFNGSPVVDGRISKWRYYSGVPLTLPSGCVFGALSVMDEKPRQNCSNMVNQLQSISRIIMNELMVRIESYPPVEIPSVPLHQEKTPLLEEEYTVEIVEEEDCIGDDEILVETLSNDTSSAITETKNTVAAATSSGENTMEAQLLNLLSQTTNTQAQIQSQQGQMVSTIGEHSIQLEKLTKQLGRIEQSLNKE